MARYRSSFSSRRSSRSTDQFVNGLFKVGKSMAKAYQAQQRENQRRERTITRFYEQQERERVRQIKQQEMAIRRAERERAKAERERERAARLQAKLDEQKRVEAEIADIEEENYMWTNVHKFISPLVTQDDINQVIEKCDYEQKNNITDGYFETKYPDEKEAKAIAREEADKKFNIDLAQRELSEAEAQLDSHRIDEDEPTAETVREELAVEAKEEIHAFLPWKQAKMRKSYIAEHFEKRFKERLDAWTTIDHEFQTRKKELSSIVKDKKNALEETKKSNDAFFKSRAKELYQKEVKAWEDERDEFYASLRQSMQNVIDGDRDYVIAAISSLFPDEELPMEYFVDFAYNEEENKVLVDLDLPEIEDLPQQKIVLTPTGKKSIRNKGLTDLRSDYANCVLGLAIQVAHSIFNVSLRVKSVEISGYTQRKDTNSAVPTDQYIFIVNFDRETFTQIDFDKLPAVQIMDFFKHYYVMLKSFDMKQIDLATAYDKMESFTVADYAEFKANNTLTNDSYLEKRMQVISSLEESSTSTPIAQVDDAPIETFEKASSFLKDFYDFIIRLSNDKAVNKHAGNLDGVVITLTKGSFTGDADTNTYRGKLFFCSIVDLYRSLKNSHINVDTMLPANYPLALIITKLYAQKEIQYSSIGSIISLYKSFIDMVKPMDQAIPVPDHFFLLGEVLFDFEQDLSWYQQYIALMQRHISIVKSAVNSDNAQRQQIESFIGLINKKGIKIGNGDV